MSVRKTTQYGGDVVMLLPNKIIKNKIFNYPPKKCRPQKQPNIGDML